MKIRSFTIITLITWLCSCSTTKQIPVGETLYTGIDRILITDADSVFIDDDILDAIDEALAYTPNNALLGSSTTRIPIPLGLWVYNANVNKKGKLRKFFFKLLAAKPVLVSSVKPETRSKNVANILRDNGYFNSISSYQIVPDKRDSLKKAKIRYEITLNEPYLLDSIEYRRMQHRGDTLLQMKESERLLRQGDMFSTTMLEAERQRISNLMRDNGYYHFRPEYIVYQADSTITPQRVNLKVSLKQGVPRSMLFPYRVGDIALYLYGYNGEPPTDSLLYKDLMIHHDGKLRIRPAILYKQIKFKKGELYSLSKQTETQTSLEKMGMFRFTEIQNIPKDSLPTCDTMIVRINTSLDYPIYAQLEMLASSDDQNFSGPGVNYGITHQNAFGGGEDLSASIYGSYNENGRFTERGIINNYELGAQATVTFPRLLLPHFGDNEYDFAATSRMSVYANQLNRVRYYKTLSFGTDISYEFVPSRIRSHILTPFKLVFNKLQKTTVRFDSITGYNPSLYQSLQDQFIPEIEYSYTLDNSAVREERSKTWWNFTVSEAGNLISGIHATFGKSFNETKKIFGNPYSQFIKATTELRYNYYINREQRLVTRIGGGIIYSYGNSQVAPYNERFYVGGANSIRAFTIRSLGPGRFIPADTPYAYIDQNGDLKFEGNIEYRIRAVGDLEMAAFLDVGNVWLLREDETRPGGKFQFKHFLKDIAVGTGLGFRYDMGMLVFRLDMGYALHFPYDTGKRGYFNTPSFGDGFALHLALGYPF